MREIILARRAFFIASALHGVTAHAQTKPDEKPDDPWAPEPNRLPAPPEDRPHHIPGVAQYTVELDLGPGVCLSPPRPTHQNAIDLTINTAPTVLAPLNADRTALGSTVAFGLRRELGRAFDVALLATVLPSVTTRGDALVPFGGTVRIATTLLTPNDWDARLVHSLDLGGGTWLSHSGPWLCATFTPLGLRWGGTGYGRRARHPIEMGLPLGVLFSSPVAGGHDTRFGPAYFTIGIELRFYLQIKARTYGD